MMHLSMCQKETKLFISLKLFDSWIECFLGTFTIYATNKYLPHCSINVTKKKCHFIFVLFSIWQKQFDARHSIKTRILLLCLCIFFALKSKWIGSDIFVFLLNNSDHGQVPLLACGAILEMMEWHWWYLILKPNFVTVFTSW